MATTPCPHCQAETLTASEAYARAGMLRGKEFPFKCSKCGGLRYLPMTGGNAKVALAILLAGVVASLPWTTRSIWPPQTAAFASLAIFAIAELLAHAVLAFGAAPRKLDEMPVPQLRPSRTIFMAALAGYFIYLIWVFLNAR